MAKATKAAKPKKESKQPIVEPIMEQIKEPEIIIPEIIQPIEDAEPIVVKEVMTEPKEVEVSISPEVLTANEEQSTEQKILSFIEGKEGKIKMNDFLKTIYGAAKFYEPAEWERQSASKELKSVLSNLIGKGFFTIANSMHLKLGTFYYDADAKTQYRNIGDVEIICEK